MNSKKISEQSALAVYFCDMEHCEPGHAFGPAIRPHYLLHVILDGKGIYQKDGKTYHLEKGSAFLIPPMESTFYQADTEDPWSYAWVGFDGKSCKEILEQTVFADSCIFTSDSDEEKEQVIHCMKDLLESFCTSWKTPLNPLGNLLLLLSCMSHPHAIAKEDYSAQYFRKAKEYIENNYTYPIRISDIARFVGIDRTYLYKIFMEQSSLSPKQYLLQHRLRIATQMLCNSSYTITEIAFSCGFKDAPAFSNYFKKYVGYTPRDFRQNFQKEKNYNYPLAISEKQV